MSLKQCDEERVLNLAKAISYLSEDKKQELVASTATYLVAEGKGEQLSLLGVSNDAVEVSSQTTITHVKSSTQEAQGDSDVPTNRPADTTRGNMTVSDRVAVPAMPFLNQVVNNDALKLLKQLPAECVDVMMTSPPYYMQRDYGGGIGNEDAVDEYLDKVLTIFELCVRVVKRTGSLFVNMGDKYEDGSLILVPYLFAKKAVERTGVKLINVITWVKPNPEPRQYKRRLVSSTEPIFHFVKSDDYHYYPQNFMAQRDTLRSGMKTGNNIGKKYFDLVEQSDLTLEQKRLAREEIQQAIQEVKNGDIASFRMKIRGIHSEAYGGHEGGRKSHLRKKGFTIIRMFDRSMKRDVIECPILNIKSLKHPAVYPEFLVQEILNLTTLPGDVVLDPFLGSGTTAVVAKRMGRHFIGFEVKKEYCELAAARIKETAVQPTLTEFYL